MTSCLVFAVSLATHPSRSHTSVGILTVETVTGAARGSAAYGRESSSRTASSIGLDAGAGRDGFADVADRTRGAAGSGATPPSSPPPTVWDGARRGAAPAVFSGRG